MILYKNVDIKDLDSILDKGILSLNASGNNNWKKNKRADNSCDVVYLFSPTTQQNSFPRYGIALLEVDIPEEDVTLNNFTTRDINVNKYAEYTTPYVSPELIINIYIPHIFKDRIVLSNIAADKVSWVDMEASYYYNHTILKKCPDSVLLQFAKTAELNSTDFDFFRGVNLDRTVIDLYEINYKKENLISLSNPGACNRGLRYLTEQLSNKTQEPNPMLRR